MGLRIARRKWKNTQAEQGRRAGIARRLPVTFLAWGVRVTATMAAILIEAQQVPERKHL
jgi:hypothetical protein